MSNHDDCVNERVIHKLSAEPPNAFLVMNYMKEIAKQFSVAWDPNDQTAVRPPIQQNMRAEFYCHSLLNEKASIVTH